MVSFGIQEKIRIKFDSYQLIAGEIVQVENIWKILKLVSENSNAKFINHWW